MPKLREKVTDLLDGLYSAGIVEDISELAQFYRDRKVLDSGTMPVPESLHAVTDARGMSDPMVPVDDKRRFDKPYLVGLGIVTDDGVIRGPLNAILSRMLTIPRMIRGYVENYPTCDERVIYTDPPMLQWEHRDLARIADTHFGQASDALEQEVELVERFKLLGEIGEEIAQEVERVYPSRGSTQAYETFGIFHLFPSNLQVDLTSTSPGVILPTEADPLRFKNAVTLLTKNLLRPTYFEMLRYSVDIAEGRIRRYSANRKGTAKNLRAYPQLSDAAKDILAEYLAIRNRFEIRLGEQDPRMKLATLVGDIGVVYSVRDPEQKSKIAHNLTVWNPEEAGRWRAVFEEQWAKGEPITSTDIIDILMAEAAENE